MESHWIHRQVEYFCVMVSDCKNLLAILFVARALNQSKSNWFNFLICKKNWTCCELNERANTFITFYVFPFASYSSASFSSLLADPAHFLPGWFWYNISLSFKQFIIFHFPAFRFNVFSAFPLVPALSTVSVPLHFEYSNAILQNSTFLPFHITLLWY